MTRPLNKPLSIPAKPNFVAGAREQELAKEAARRHSYVISNYKVWWQHFARRLGFNESFRLLQKTLACSSNIEAVLDTLHPDMRFALTYCAQEHADKRGHLGTLTSTDIESGARAIVDRLSVKRGRPKDHVLRFHIEGMMALLHDSCGIAVKAALVRADTYAPQATNGLGQLVVDSFRNANPALTETTIVNMMIEARHKHARKLLRFENYFPGYGATVTPF